MRIKKREDNSSFNNEIEDSSLNNWDTKQINDLVDMLILNVQSEKNFNFEFYKGQEDKSEARKQILDYVERILIARETPHTLIPVIKKHFSDYMWGFYILQPFIEADDVFDIKCHSYNHIRLKKAKGKITANVCFPDKNDYERFVKAIATRNHVSLSDINADVTFVDKYSCDKFRLRFTISTPLINDNDTYIMEIRKSPKTKYTIEKLVDLKVLRRPECQYLKDIMKHGTGVAIFGRGGSGKTILYNALIEEYPHDKAGIILQENEELFSQRHPDMIFQHIVRPQGEGSIDYTLGKLTRYALLFDVELIGIGEIKDKEEASELAKAVYTGAFGMLTSHGQNAIDGLVKLADYVKQGTGYDIEQCLKMLTGLQACVYMQDFEVKEIIEIKGWNKEDNFLEYSYIYKKKNNNNTDYKLIS